MPCMDGIYVLRFNTFQKGGVILWLVELQNSNTPSHGCLNQHFILFIYLKICWICSEFSPERPVLQLEDNFPNNVGKVDWVWI